MGELAKLAAASDRTFTHVDERTGVGANVEHLVPRALSETNDLLNLGFTHPARNAEKGRNWDPPRERRHRAEEYDRLVRRLLGRRRERWREPG